MEKNIEDFLRENPNPSNEDIARWKKELTKKENESPTPIADKLLAPGAARQESVIFLPPVPKDTEPSETLITSDPISSDVSIETSPDKKTDKDPVLKQISFKELLPWLSQSIDLTKNSPVNVGHLANKFETSHKGAEEIIKQLKTLKILNSAGIIDTMALDEKFETAGDETLDFFEDPDDSLSIFPVSKVVALDPTATTPTVSVASTSPAIATPAVEPVVGPTTSAITPDVVVNPTSLSTDLSAVTPSPALAPTIDPAAAPDTPDNFEKTLRIGDLLNFLMEKANEIKDKKVNDKFADGDDILNAENLQKEFNISKESADFIINLMNKDGILVDGKLIELVSLEPIIISLQSQINEDILAGKDTPTTPDSDKTNTKPTTPAEPIKNEPSPDEDHAEESPEENIDLSREKLISVEKITNIYYEILSNKYTKKIAAAVVISIGALAVGGASFVLYKGSINEGTTASAPDNKKPSSGKATNPVPSFGKNMETNPGPEKNIASGILNPNYEKEGWWMEIDPEIQKDMKEIISSENAKAYSLQFFKQIEFLNVAGYININDKTKSDLYDNLDRIPEILNLSYGDTPRITACEITLEDSNTKQKKECYLRTNLSEIAKKYHKIIGLVLGGNMMEMFPQGQKLSDSYTWMRAKIIAEINTKTVKK